MSPLRSWMRLLVRPFYREQAGLFVLGFTLLFFIIGKVDGAELGEYHRSLARALCRSRIFRCCMFGAWLLYARHYGRFVARLLQSAAYSFLYPLRAWHPLRRWLLFFGCDALLLLPVLGYGLFVVVYALRNGHGPAAAETGVVLALLLLFPPLWHSRLLLRDGTHGGTAGQSSHYLLLLLTVVLRYWPGTALLLKAVGCGFLLAVSLHNELDPADWPVLFFFFSFTVCAHSVLIRRVVTFERTKLAFFDSLPLSALRRVGHYALFYALLNLPEALVLGVLTPAHLPLSVALAFGCFAWSCPLLFHYAGLLAPVSRRRWLWGTALLAVVIYTLALAFSVVSACLAPLLLVLFPAAFYFPLRSRFS